MGVPCEGQWLEPHFSGYERLGAVPVDQHTLTTLRGVAQMLRNALLGRRLLVLREDGGECAVSQIEVVQPRGLVIRIECEATSESRGDG